MMQIVSNIKWLSVMFRNGPHCSTYCNTFGGKMQGASPSCRSDSHQYTINNSALSSANGVKDLAFLITSVQVALVPV